MASGMAKSRAQLSPHSRMDPIMHKEWCNVDRPSVQQESQLTSGWGSLILCNPPLGCQDHVTHPKSLRREEANIGICVVAQLLKARPHDL